MYWFIPLSLRLAPFFFASFFWFSLFNCTFSLFSFSSAFTNKIVSWEISFHMFDSESRPPAGLVLSSFFFLLFFAVPSTVPTSEALLPRRSSRHPSPPATPRAHSASRPRPQRSTGSDVRSLVGCHPKETLHCCWVTSVVFSSACSDSTYAGHHLLCPRLTTMLAKSRSQTEWVSPQRADRRYVPPPILLCGLSDVEGFWSELPQAREDGGTPRLRPPRECDMKGYRSWDFFLFSFFNLCSDRWGWGW